MFPQTEDMAHQPEDEKLDLEEKVMDVEEELEDKVHEMGRKATFDEVTEEIIRINPDSTRDLTVERLRRGVNVNLNDPSYVIGNLMWQNLQIRNIPAIIGDLTIQGTLCLTGNGLMSIPEGFGSLTVWDNLMLDLNPFTVLPKDFGSLTVGNALYIDRKFHERCQSMGFRIRQLGVNGWQ